MEPEKINHPYLTAIKRTSLSAPTRYLLQHSLLKGRILDFGCGYGFDTDELKRQGYDIGKHSVNHVFSSPTSIINFTSKKPSYDDTRRSGRDNELLQRAQNDL